MCRSGHPVFYAGDGKGRTEAARSANTTISLGAVMQMQIVIPTRGRIDQQITLQQLPRELRKRTTIVCPEEEAVPLACCWPDVGIVFQPDPTMTIARKR